MLATLEKRGCKMWPPIVRKAATIPIMVHTAFLSSGDGISFTADPTGTDNNKISEYTTSSVNSILFTFKIGEPV